MLYNAISWKIHMVECIICESEFLSHENTANNFAKNNQSSKRNHETI